MTTAVTARVRTAATTVPTRKRELGLFVRYRYGRAASLRFAAVRLRRDALSFIRLLHAARPRHDGTWLFGTAIGLLTQGGLPTRRRPSHSPGVGRRRYQVPQRFVWDLLRVLVAIRDGKARTDPLVPTWAGRRGPTSRPSAQGTLSREWAVLAIHHLPRGQV